jgi:PilZ domain-containing protein
MQRRIGDRRRKPRFEIVGDLFGSVDVTVGLRILNLGRGGALVDSPLALVPGSVHAVRAVGNGESHPMTIRVRHSTATAQQGHRRYLLGVEFLNVTAALDDFLVRHVGLGNNSISAEA